MDDLPSCGNRTLTSHPNVLWVAGLASDGSGRNKLQDSCSWAESSGSRERPIVVRICMLSTAETRLDGVDMEDGQ